MRSYLTLRELIKDCGAIVLEERLPEHPADEARTVFRSHDQTRFRLVWREAAREGMLQAPDTEGTWQPRGPVVRYEHRRLPYQSLRGFLNEAERLAGVRDPA